MEGLFVSFEQLREAGIEDYQEEIRKPDGVERFLRAIAPLNPEAQRRLEMFEEEKRAAEVTPVVVATEDRLDDERSPSPSMLRDVLGEDVTFTVIASPKGGSLWVEEEGELKGRLPNPRASRLMGYNIYGPAVFVPENPGEDSATNASMAANDSVNDDSGAEEETDDSDP